VQEAEGLDSALACAASAIIAGPFAAECNATKAVLIADQPRLAFARAATLFLEEEPFSGIHPSALVHPAARLGENVTVAECAVIQAGAIIGENTHIGPGSIIAEKVVIGRHCRLFPNVTIYAGVALGDRVVIHAGAVLGSDGFGYVPDKATGRYSKFPQIGRLEVEDDVEIGANTTIDRGALDLTRIGRGTKIDNLVHIGHNVDIGEDVVIAAQTGISGGASVGNGVVIGGQVGMGERARIEEGAIIGGQSGILGKKVIRGKGVVFWGTPARPLRAYLKELAVLARLAKKE
jgi:UDP-3-O-[3-hydroxymyristoyl] glucosamine N-acyltransferase